MGIFIYRNKKLILTTKFPRLKRGQALGAQYQWMKNSVELLTINVSTGTDAPVSTGRTGRSCFNLVKVLYVYYGSICATIFTFSVYTKAGSAHKKIAYLELKCEFCVFLAK